MLAALVRTGAMLNWLWISGLVIILDQITKWIADRSLELHVPVPVMPSFNFTLVYNSGAAFSFLSEAGGWQRWFFSLLTISICALLLIWLKRLDAHEKPAAIGLSLVLGGALGNLIDRLMYGYVIDFIQWYYYGYYWPTFNIADSAISVGATLLVVQGLFFHEKSQQGVVKK
jgi:signal peptidase II